MDEAGPIVPLLGAPTASGKSGLAIELARHLPLEVITADAMQVYVGMDIGTAKPGVEERSLVPHHLIDLVTPAQTFSVADWVREAEEAIAQTLARGRLPLVVGGTGFYLQALSRGLPTVPAADPELQEPIWRELAERGLDALVEELREASPIDAERSQRNPRRVVRALEVLRRTGRPPSEFPYDEPRFRTSLAVLEPPLEALRPRIVQRCRRMFELGLAAEVRSLLERFPAPLTAMQAIGYKEVARALSGEISLEEAEREVQLATVRYAKRQLTWFRRQAADLRSPLLAQDALPLLVGWLARLKGFE
ncbi:MAG TPA: tRNA (adenosine(37)-N6)-dimethylallyltransferase MiaA [Trueperaceae bacterium]